MKERDISRYLNKRVKELGGEIRRVTWQGRRNAPDKLVMLDHSSGWVEEKRPGEKPTSAQAREHTRMRNAGMRVFVVSNEAEADAALATLCRVSATSIRGANIAKMMGDI